MIRIWADFNALQGEYLALDFEGSFRDIRRQRVELSEGLHVIIYDDSYQSEAIVEKVKGVWLARLIPGTRRDALANPPPPIDENEPET